MLRFCSALLAGLTSLCLGGCSAPTSPTSTYPQNPTISDDQGRPQDSTTFYFPPTDSLHATYIPKKKRPYEYIIDEKVMNCAYPLEHASYTLTYFTAPVLSNYYLGADIVRFLWLRSFQRPVLLTLRRDSAGISIHTQFLNKSPGFYIPSPPLHPDNLPAGTSEKRKASVRKDYEQTIADPTYWARVAEAKRRAVQVLSEDATQPVTQQQWQHLQALLSRTQFQQLPACQPRPGLLDGAYWLLESHQASGYHMVFRHSPSKQDGFRKACEYLLELSSARKEKRY